MYRLLLPLIALGILLAPPAFGFFDVLENLQQELTEEPPESNALDLDDLIHELEETTQTTPVSFTDVPDSAWFASAVSAVSGRGIVSGYKDKAGNPTGTFGPANPVTIAEMLKMAYNAAGKDVATCRSYVSLSQAASHWAKSYVACAEEDGMRVLRSNIDLNRGATRAEVLAILHDAFGRLVPAVSSPFSDTAGNPYAPDIGLAASEGVVTGDKKEDGTPKGTFRPNDGVNRAEAAQIIFKSL